ncbi:MAG: hypothetical protein KJP09_01195 [Bacteroidia bacterium]|nr:hypothetical protein [Bacteroidia bacterium]MBT8311202.1 hypothetical protein [Bacteroidia bacterium]NND11187.1 hypothetical protein [Flavobacteriaceae bacterium]NNL60237.1 hypothetical protein [Flavobacteriaceae bacterium]
MGSTTENTVEFYQNLGKLFYAIAASDNNVNELEILALKRIVKTEWSSFEDASQIVDVFDWLNVDQEYDADICFKNFIAFKHRNEQMFPDSTKQLISKTANEIASSFAGRNKSELIMLARLDLEFKNEDEK